jgi:hypothetical protein
MSDNDPTSRIPCVSVHPDYPGLRAVISYDNISFEYDDPSTGEVKVLGTTPAEPFVRAWEELCNIEDAERDIRRTL